MTRRPRSSASPDNLFQKTDVLAHADEFRRRGKTVVIGGPMANLLPEVCRPHCDVLFEGEAEYTWPRFLREYAAGRWSDSYVETEKIHLPDSPPPRLDLVLRRYAHGIVQCTRGCPFSCEFCDIIVMYGRKMRFKPVEQVIAEVAAWRAQGRSDGLFRGRQFRRPPRLRQGAAPGAGQMELPAAPAAGVLHAGQHRHGPRRGAAGPACATPTSTRSSSASKRRARPASPRRTRRRTRRSISSMRSTPSSRTTCSSWPG